MTHKMTAADRAKRLLDDINKKQAAVNERLRKQKEVATRRLSALTFKEDTREMTLIGKYMLPANRSVIESALKRADVAEHDRKFLAARGWDL